MDERWIGRTLMRASRVLAARLREAETEAGVGAPVVASIAAPLVREAGRSLALGESEPPLALLRARGLLRIPAGMPSTALARAFNALWSLVRAHLRELPGLTPEMEVRVREALRHGARTLVALHRLRLAGEPSGALEAQSGIVVVVAFARAQAG